MTVEAPVAPDAPDEKIPEDPRALAGAPAAAAQSLLTAEPTLAAEPTPEPIIGVRQLQGGIIEVALPPNREIEGPEARAAGAAVRTLADGLRVPVLLNISGVVGVSAEARQVYAGSIAASAFALVGESPVDRVIAHYLLRSRTETIPAEFFLSRTEALEWLRPYTSEK
ncbi:hypothetical protein FFF93_003460 [Arthrobacter sp. KBS0702]|uniref:DUF7793 family protein n=1 Tax=Arthrobacter sp. KBS0702 TaxID=2578107 RepID=UPI00110ECAB7|nr:hypothetical protein [Arthrobacter sp. KBS0702]QDW28945.1 hypothetical protein FFF93_003460 [Arthrobacter sp. KBS0702]